MKARPTIFLSGVSHEFGSLRDAVEIEIQKKGCFAENQSSFAPAYHTVEEMLRRKLKDSDAVIHIVGFRFGAEPNQRPADKPRRSYTQMEFDIAREMQKPIFVFLSADSSVRDLAKPDEKQENGETVALQQAHRQAVQNSNHLYYFFKDQAELCKLVAEIPVIAHAGEFKADISRIVKYAPAELIGREEETKLLNDAWAKVRAGEPKRPRVLTFVALGGEGKTSLMAKWAADLAHQDWPGCDAALAWSFYSQGTREQLAASSDLFLNEALTFFGDEAMAGSAAGAFEKGRRLAKIVGERRALLILDGLEPLQYAPTSPTPGELKDQGVAALLRALAAASHGLCVVTTRYSLPDLRAFWQTTAPEVKLLRLSPDAGVHLLKTLGVRGTAKEFETLVEEVKGHALTLTLLGGFLQRAFRGDIRQRDRVKFEKADEKMEGGHAFRTMAAYEEWLLSGGDEGRREVSVLRLMGLFDRPAAADCLAALRSETISGLTEPLVGLADDDWGFCLGGLETAKLLTISRDSAGALVSLDAHPLLREYFARQLRMQQPNAWRAAHRRLYEHLRGKAAWRPDTLDGLDPLLQAVVHACAAGEHQDAYSEVYRARISRDRRQFLRDTLGIVSADLVVQSAFIEIPWRKAVAQLAEPDQASVLVRVGLVLRLLGRFQEAEEGLQAGLTLYVDLGNADRAANAARHLSQLHLLAGDLKKSLKLAESAVSWVEKLDKPAVESVASLANLGDILHHEGQLPEAEVWFQKAEALQPFVEPEYPRLCRLQGYRYGELLLSQRQYQAAFSRAKEMVEWSKTQEFILGSGTSLLMLAQVYGFAPREECIADMDRAKATMDEAVTVLRQAGQVTFLARALISRAKLPTAALDAGEAAGDLDEALEFAERGPMKLLLADIHLHRAQLFGAQKADVKRQEYRWVSPQADLAAARQLIESCGYWRRKEELENAEKNLL